MATKTGLAAEARAAEYLKKLGYKILAQNWRTRWCEIDLVATKGGVVHIIEVKYRANPNFGSGLEYITRSKLEQLIKASRFYQSEHGSDRPIQIDAIEVMGPVESPEVNLVENITL